MLGSIAECKYKHDISDRQRGRVSGVDRVDSRVKAQVVKACNAPFGIAPVDTRFFGVYLVAEAVAIFEFDRLQKLVSVKEGQREARESLGNPLLAHHYIVIRALGTTGRIDPVDAAQIVRYIQIPAATMTIITVISSAMVLDKSCPIVDETYKSFSVSDDLISFSAVRQRSFDSG